MWKTTYSLSLIVDLVDRQMVNLKFEAKITKFSDLAGEAYYGER